MKDRHLINKMKYSIMLGLLQPKDGVNFQQPNEKSLDEFLRSIAGARLHGACGADYGTLNHKITAEELDLAKIAYKEYLEESGHPFKAGQVETKANVQLEFLF